MIDVSSELGQQNTFMISLQPHSWRADKYRGADGGTLRPTENQASMLVLVKGLPRLAYASFLDYLPARGFALRAGDHSPNYEDPILFVPAHLGGRRGRLWSHWF